MKKKVHIFFSMLMLMSISWQCGAKSIIYFTFKYRQKELAQTVCENKNKPGSCCKAKCYLAKEIKKEEKRQSDFPSSLKDKSEKSELFAGFISFSHLQTVCIQIITFHYFHSIPKSHLGSVFHPPTV